MLNLTFLFTCASVVIFTDILLQVTCATYEQNQVWEVLNSNLKCAGKFQCRNGACVELDKVCDQVKHCLDGSDEDDFSCMNRVNEGLQQVTFCEPLISTEMVIKCLYEDKDVACYENVRPGTLAEMDCKLDYHALATATLYHNYCQEDGQWLHPLPNCQPLDCRSHDNDLISSGNGTVIDTPANTEDTVYPWNAMIYRKDENNNLMFSGVMGSLITEYAVVTDILGPYGPGLDVYSPLDVTKLKIVFGQKYRDLDDPRNTNLQYFDVSKVHLFSDYLPTHSRICVVELSHPVLFNTTDISPVCVDINRRFSIVNESVFGTTYGWDSTNKTDELLKQALPFIGRIECYKYVQQINIESLFDHDTEQEEYCAGFRNGTKLTRDIKNKGSAFIYNFDGRQFLYGVAKSILKVQSNESTLNELYVFNDVRNDFIFDFINSTAENIRAKFERTCKPILATYSMAVECEYKSKPISCSDKMPIGSVAKSRCIGGYKPTSTQSLRFNNYCKNDGDWLYPILECVHECGKLEAIDESDKNRVFSPWLANIYKWRDSRYVFSCTGVLVSPSSVLTEEGCSDPSGSGIVNKTSLKIAIGKNHIFYLDTRDANAQYFDIEEIYFGNNTGLAVMELTTLVSVNKYASPICIDFNKKYTLTKSSQANVIYWDYHYNKKDSLDLLNSTVTYIESNAECKSILANLNYYQPERLDLAGSFCAIYNNDTTANLSGSGLLDRGTSLSSQFMGKYYLFGVLKFRLSAAKDDGSDKKTIHAFTNVTDTISLQFINATLFNITKKRSVPLNKCVVPTSFGTKYSRLPCGAYEDCKEIPTTEFIDQFNLIHINCKDGFALADEGYSYTTCNKGKWQPERNACVRLCEPIASKSTWTQCSYNGREVRCDQKMRPGTVSISDCSTGYISAEPTEFYNNTCLEDGQWMRPQQQCLHTCGIIKTPRPLIQDGVVANKTQHPWNAAIYLRNKFSTEHICGGTLISPSTILTAGHCVYNQTLRTNFPAEAFVIGLGKEHRTFKHTDDVNAEYINVRYVHIPSFYDGRSINFLFDIAIFELESPAKLSNTILPACVDANHEYRLSPNSKGIVVGWGYDNVKGKGKPNELLHKAELPYLSLDVCSKSLSAKDKGTLTKDKFCAFYTESDKTTTVRSGDSGAGLIFEFDDRYYVMGLVSTQIYNTISTFTDIRIPMHLDFITRTVQNITRKHYNNPTLFALQ